MKKIILASIVLITCLGSIKAQEQEAYILTLEESIAVAKKQSYTMMNLKENLKIAEYNLKWATSRLKTKINMELGLPDYEETLKQWEDSLGISYFSSRLLNINSGLTIKQPLPTDGEIFIRAGAGTIDDLNKNLRSSTLNTRIGFTQPIDIIYGYSSMRTSLKKAELNYEHSNKSLKRAELKLVYDVSDMYYRLLSLQKQTEIASLDLERQSEAYEISKNKYDAGLIREVDLLQMEVDLAEAQNNYDIAILNQDAQINQFKKLIGLNLSDNIVLNSKLDYSSVLVDPDIAVKYALSNRLEIREYEIRIEEQKLNIKQQKVNGRIRGNINAYVEKYGISNPKEYLNYPNSLNDSYNSFIDSRRPNFGIGFTVSIPILDWGENKALVKAAEAQLKQNILGQENEIREIETEVRNLSARLNSNLKRLRSLEKNIVVAEKSFEITLQRFSDGDIDSQALALERNRLNTAYRSHLSAYIEYQLSIADLTQKTFYDFENNKGVE